MKTYNELYLSTRNILRQRGVEGYNLEARLLVAQAAGKSTADLLRDMNLYTTDAVEQKVLDYTARRLRGEPVAYITGLWEFYGLPMIVTPDVLIPRMDTEVLVDTAKAILTGRKMDARILDLCCASGCIACAIGHEMPATRLVAAGASAFTLDDTTGYRGYNRWGGKFRGGAADGEIVHPVVSRKIFLAKTKAGLDACAGSDCMAIARTESKLQYGLDEAIERCLLAEELGAEMTLIIGLMNMDEAKKVADAIPGWKMWPDVGSKNGVPDVQLDDIEKLGFNFVTCHILEKAAMWGMIDFGKHACQEKSLVYHDTHTMGMKKEDVEQGIVGMQAKNRKRMWKPDKYTLKEPYFWKDLPGEPKEE